MKPWISPEIPKLPGVGIVPAIYDSASGHLVEPAIQNGVAGLYVCGITPYDATHLGHAFTYLAFDTLQRAWLDAGLSVNYVQNITDVDDPLLERAAVTHVDWADLASSQIELFREDMHALSVIAPTKYVAVTETIELISSAVADLLESGYAYTVAVDEQPELFDIYFDTQRASERSAWTLAQVSGLDLADLLRLSAERGGDPDRPGKRHPLDPCLWRAARPHEPSWESSVGTGRPGWHIECSAIAVKSLGTNFAVQGGGLDLLFPHHEFSAAHACCLTDSPLAQVYAHAGLVSYQGEKMSKSRGNLVFVSRLLQSGVEPSAIRLALLRHHYRSSWEWFDDMIDSAEAQLGRWRLSLAAPSVSQNSVANATEVVSTLRALLASDLSTPEMIALLDQAFTHGTDDSELIRRAAQSLLGITV